MALFKLRSMHAPGIVVLTPNEHGPANWPADADWDWVEYEWDRQERSDDDLEYWSDIALLYEDYPRLPDGIQFGGSRTSYYDEEV